MKPDSGLKSRFLPSHLRLMLQLVGPHWNIAVMFGVEKLEWCGYTMVKNFEDTFVYSYRQNIST